MYLKKIELIIYIIGDMRQIMNVKIHNNNFNK